MYMSLNPTAWPCINSMLAFRSELLHIESGRTVLWGKKEEQADAAPLTTALRKDDAFLWDRQGCPSPVTAHDKRSGPP